MYEHIIQLFWGIIFILAFIGAVTIPCAFYEYLMRRDMRRLHELATARDRWGQMVQGNDRP